MKLKGKIYEAKRFMKLKVVGGSHRGDCALLQGSSYSLSIEIHHNRSINIVSIF